MNDDELKAAERNRFFYGKLLTADDFTMEQNYFNTKIRLLNRLLFGSGVVAGLKVVKADDQSAAIDCGIALDHAGREIIVPEPVVIKINELDGYDEIARANTDYTKAYLCIEYNETRTQPIHSIAATALDDENDGPEYNRITEGYSLYITAEEPEENPCESQKRLLAKKILIEGNVGVYFVFPRSVCAGEEFILETHIDKGNGEKEILLEFDLKLEALTSENGTSSVHVSYNRTNRTDHEVIRTKLKACSSLSDKGIIKTTNVRAFCNKTRLEYLPVYAETAITDDADFSAPESLKSPGSDRAGRLYLARLGLYISPQYFILESVKNLPFSQIVPNPIDLQAFRLRSGFTRESTVQNAEVLPVQQVKPLTNSGFLSIEIPQNSQKGSVFRSAEVPHGLGTGIVFINAGFVGKSSVIFESSSVLNRYFTYGVSVNKETGMFSISVKLNCDTEKAKLNFCWLATRLPDKSVTRGNFEITPSVHYTGRYETVQFTVSHPDGGVWKSGELEWSVQPDDGGSITQNGVFTAFDKPGFYEISVSSVDEPELKASAFLVVK